MKHFPSIEALTDADDRRLLAELEICQVLEKLARLRALVDRADHLLAHVLVCHEEGDAGTCTHVDDRVCRGILASLRRS